MFRSEYSALDNWISGTDFIKAKKNGKKAQTNETIKEKKNNEMNANDDNMIHHHFHRNPLANVNYDVNVHVFSFFLGCCCFNF